MKPSGFGPAGECGDFAKPRADIVLDAVSSFESGDDGLARKSRELTIHLLSHTPAPLRRDQFTPGHITCTALVLHPADSRILLMHHHRLHRWLLPGGHIEETDESLAAAAAREAAEETAVHIDAQFAPFLAGIDVHGIPPKRDEPFHLHHDLIWCFRALDTYTEITPEAREVIWSGEDSWDGLGVAESIRNSVRRAVGFLK